LPPRFTETEHPTHDQNQRYPSVDGKKFTGFLYDGANGRKVPAFVVTKRG